MSLIRRPRCEWRIDYTKSRQHRDQSNPNDTDTNDAKLNPWCRCYINHPLVYILDSRRLHYSMMMMITYCCVLLYLTKQVEINNPENSCQIQGWFCFPSCLVLALEMHPLFWLKNLPFVVWRKAYSWNQGIATMTSSSSRSRFSFQYWERALFFFVRARCSISFDTSFFFAQDLGRCWLTYWRRD